MIGAATQAHERTFPIRGPGDVPVVRAQAQRLARDFGFPIKRAAELAIVVSELASNIVKYGVRGEIQLTLDGGAPGEIRIVARDVGPPIRDLQLAMTDGYDDRGPIDPAAMPRRGGLGTGLGAVSRFADRFEYRQEAAGKAITVAFRR